MALYKVSFSDGCFAPRASYSKFREKPGRKRENGVSTLINHFKQHRVSNLSYSFSGIHRFTVRPHGPEPWTESPALKGKVRPKAARVGKNPGGLGKTPVGWEKSRCRGGTLRVTGGIPDYVTEQRHIVDTAIVCYAILMGLSIQG